MFRSTLPSRTAVALVAVAALAAGVWLAAPLAADDRDLLRTAAADPFVFIILDSSGSMNWSPPCTQADYDTFIDDDHDTEDGVCPSSPPATPCVRKCNFVCPSGDCLVPRDGDDPGSKMRQAKEALYEVFSKLRDINFGFATYNQDDLYVSNKNWLYSVAAGAPQYALAGGDAFPVIGSQEVFGVTNTCDSDGGGNRGRDADIGCYANQDVAADTNNIWEATRVRRLSKLGTNGSTAVNYYIRSGGRVYYVTTSSPSGSQTLGSAAITLRYQIYICTGTPNANPANGCDASSERSLLSSINVPFDRVGDGDFVRWDYQVRRTPPQDGYFGLQNVNAGNTCAGWDPNSLPAGETAPGGATESSSSPPDPHNGYDLRFPNGTRYYNPINNDNDWRFRYGDVVPLSWLSDNADEILNRLAPGRRSGGDPATNSELFGDARYLNNVRSGSDAFLKLKTDALGTSYNAERPIIPTGSTPLGNALRSFRQWYRGCADTSTCAGGTGWDDFASATDSSWGCRKKFIIFLTDGDETCSSDPCSYTEALHTNDGVNTYVIGFGVDGTTGNQLVCMAERGGTVAPIYPQNKHDLVEALNDIFNEIRESSAAFASAAVPSVQANVADKIYLTSFNPVDKASTWAGRLDAYLKPLPVDRFGFPDRTTRVCGAFTSNCFLWDAGDSQLALSSDTANYNPERLLLQAPFASNVVFEDNSTLKLGAGDDNRRVFYGRSGLTGNRRLFDYPASTSDRYDLWSGLEIPFIAGNSGSEAAARDRADAIIKATLQIKEDEITFTLIHDPDDPMDDETITSDISYLMGDIFHSNPVVWGQPAKFELYTQDPYKGAALCGSASDPTRQAQVSYVAFADRNACRRKLLVAGSNDGQLHVFDAGIFRGSDCLFPAKDFNADGAINSSDLDVDGDGQPDYDQDDDNGVINGAFDNGTGRELFSFIPRAMLPRIRQIAESNEQIWSLDGSVRIDDAFIDPHATTNGSVACTSREWRTLMVGGYREGGPGYFALDVTQPDTYDSAKVPQPLSSGYVPSCLDGGTGCGGSAYPAVIWEFQDQATVNSSTVMLDEDLNDRPDLANSWSRPGTGRIRVCTGGCSANETEDRFVAVFGGGLGDDPSTVTGNYVYMVDLETGKTLYKKRVEGSVPADVAAVDLNGDGYLDTLYFGTTAGFLYKASLDLPTSPMKIATQTITTRVAGTNYSVSVQRIVGPSGEAKRYDPFKVFTTGGRPIYFEVGVLFVPQRAHYALAFGTGNRWDLWAFDGSVGRFYMILDTDFADADHNDVVDAPTGVSVVPLTESNYQAIAADAPFDPGSPPPNYLLATNDSTPGWYITLQPDERVITEAFALSGITFFTSYEPQATVESGDDGPTCSKTGTSHIFIVGTYNAIGYSIPEGATLNDRVRYSSAPAFTTQPYTEQSATKNPSTQGTNSDEITETLALIESELQSTLPSTCRFANYTLNLKTIRSDTGVVFIAPVPICIEPTNWKEF
ncbi:MAG: hypothetical protein U0X73_13315 [Thermoanaerobaculia bacterium]